MHIQFSKKKRIAILVTVCTILIFGLSIVHYRKQTKEASMVMGGNLITLEIGEDHILDEKLYLEEKLTLKQKLTLEEKINLEENHTLEEVNIVEQDHAIEQNNTAEQANVDVETYFRPSNLPVLNTRDNVQFFDSYQDEKTKKVKLPENLLDTPENTLLNYFSILREAANPVKGKSAGCGTLGDAQTPYPIAYQFLTTEYQKELSFKAYQKTFQNILHTNLIKMHEVPVYANKDKILRYFVELETIEGTERNTGVFAYYYGYVDLKKEDKEYKISNLEFTAENYLCAPYHGWAYDAEASVQIRYGGWCNLIQSMNPIVQKGYVKNVSFVGTDGYEYRIVFYQLTNGTDVEIAQYRKKENRNWEQINLDPRKCLEEKDKKEKDKK